MTKVSGSFHDRKVGVVVAQEELLDQNGSGVLRLLDSLTELHLTQTEYHISEHLVGLGESKIDWNRHSFKRVTHCCIS